MRWVFLLIFACCIFVQALNFDLERKGKWFHFQLPKGQVNCVDALFSLDAHFSGKSKEAFSIEEDSQLECCKLSLKTEFLFKSAAFTKSIEVNLLDEVNSVKSEFEEGILIYSPATGLEISQNIAFVELLPLEYLEVKSFGRIFACSKSILYNRLGSYEEFLRTLSHKEDCHLVLRHSASGMEPLSDDLAIGEILSSEKYEFVSTYPVHFVNYKKEIFLTRYFPKPTSEERGAVERELKLFKLVVFSEFSCIIPNINQIQVYWQDAEASTLVVEFPRVLLPLEIVSKGQILHSLLFDPFEEVKCLREKIQMHISPWICKSLLLGKRDIYQPRLRRHVKERTLLERLFFEYRSFVSSEYVKDCLWEYVDSVQEVVHLEATVLFPVQALDATVAFYDITIPLSVVEAEHSLKAESSVVIVPPYSTLSEKAFPLGRTYKIASVPVVIPWQRSNFLRFEVDLMEEVPFYAQVLQLLAQISSQPSYRFEETSSFPINLQELNEVISIFSSSLSVAHLQKPQEMPLFCKRFPESPICQNVLFLEHNHQQHRNGIYLTWGFPKEETIGTDIDSTLEFSRFNVHIQMSKFSIFNFNHPTKVQIAVFICPLPAAKIAYFHNVKNWDPTAKYNHNFENIDWLVEFVSRIAPYQVLEHVSYRRIQSFLAASIAFAFELFGELVGKWEYSIITTYLIQPYFSKFIAFAESSSNSSASFAISLLLKVWRWNSTTRYLLFASPYVAKYLEVPILSSTLNQLLNSFSQLKQIPLACAKRILFHFFQKYLNHSSEHSMVVILDPKTFDSRILPWKKAETASSSPVQRSIWKHISHLDARPIFLTFWSFGLKRYISLRTTQQLLLKAKALFFEAPTPENAAASNSDYSEPVDSVLLARIAQKCHLEPSAMSPFELALASALKKLLNSFEVSAYTSPYSARIIALYLASWLGRRTMFLLTAKQQEIDKEIAPIHDQVAKLAMSVHFIDEAIKRKSEAELKE